MKQIVLIVLFFTPYFLSGQTSFQFVADKDMPLLEILSTVSNNYNIQFAYPSELTKDVVINHQYIDQTSLNDFMTELLKNTSIEFQCSGNDKVLLRKRKSTPQKKEKITFHGVVMDETSNELLAHGAIYLEDMSNGSFTDEQGKFELTISKADLDKKVVISFLGFEEKIIPIQDLNKTANLFLKPQIVAIENIIISHSMPRIKSDLKDNAVVLNKKSFANNRANYLGGSDILKSVQLLPGVSADDDSSCDIKIRGSNADETMLLLDGMPIYNASHYYGIFSSIQTDYIDEVRLYKNIFPIQYSGVTAGLLKMDSGGFSDEFNGTVNVNTLNTSIALQTPISKKLSFNLGGRTSLGNVTQYAILNDPNEDFSLSINENQPNDNGDKKDEKFQQYKPEFKFYDLNAKLIANLSDHSSLSFSLFNSSDLYNNAYEREFKSQGPNNSEPMFSETFKFRHEWKNLTGGSTYHIDFNDDFAMDAAIHVSKYFEETDLNSTIEVNENQMETNHGTIATSSSNEIQDIGLNLSFVQKKKNILTYGLAVNQYETAYELDNAQEKIRNVDAEATKITGFGSYNFDWKKLTVEIGTRATYYSGKYEFRKDYDGFFLSPQLLATYRLNDLHAFKFSLGRNNQFLREINYENRVGQAVTIYSLASENTVGVSDNLMLGYQFKKGNWMIDFELFHKDMDGVIEFTNVNPGFKEDMPGQQRTPEYRLFSGTGKSIGFDFLINYQSKNYHTWVAYTLSKTTNQVGELFNNAAYPNQNDRRHQLKWINNLKFKKFNFSFNTIFSSGKPYLAIRNLNENNKREFDPDLVYSYLPYYARIDLGVSYNFKLFKQDAAFGVSCFNLTNRQNVKFNQQTYSIKHQDANQNNISTVIGSESELLNRTLDFNFKLRF